MPPTQSLRASDLVGNRVNYSCEHMLCLGDNDCEPKKGVATGCMTRTVLYTGAKLGPSARAAGVR